MLPAPRSAGRAGSPASTVTSPAVASTDLIAVSPAGLSSTPSVLAAGVNECPVPVILTARPSAAARVTASATSAAVRGASTRAGVAVTFPAQLRQVALAGMVIGDPPVRLRCRRG